MNSWKTLSSAKKLSYSYKYYLVLSLLYKPVLGVVVDLLSDADLLFLQIVNPIVKLQLHFDPDCVLEFTDFHLKEALHVTSYEI